MPISTQTIQLSSNTAHFTIPNTELSILIPKQAVTLPTLSLLQNRGLPISAGGEGYDRSQNNAKPIALTQIKQGRLKSFQTALFYTHSNKVSCRSGEPQTVCTCGKAGRQRSQVICLNRHHSIDGLHAAQSAGLPALGIIRPCPAKRAIHSTSARPRRGRVPSVPPATFRQTGCRWRGQSVRLGAVGKIAPAHALEQR